MSHKCHWCGHVTSSEERLKHHVCEHHREKLDQTFRMNYVRSGCKDPECQYRFSLQGHHPGLVCPNCDHDHSRYFANVLTSFW